MNLRGRYEGGGCVVTAKHWWSRKERESARIAAQVLEYQWNERKREARLLAHMYANSSATYWRPAWTPTSHGTEHEEANGQS